MEFRITRLVLMLALFVFPLLGLHAQVPLFQMMGATEGGSCYEVCLYNDHLYAGTANTLMCYALDGGQRRPGTKVQQIRLRSNIVQMEVRGGYLYVAANHAGLYKYAAHPTTGILTETAHYVPASIDESIYDFDFAGDTVFVAAKHKLQMLRDQGTSFQYIGDFVSYTGTARVHGLDIKDNWLAYTLGFSASLTADGVHLVDLNTLQEVGAWSQGIFNGDSWEVYFAENSDQIHVMGGKEAIGWNGRYFVLDYSTPSNIVEAFDFTIQGNPLSLSVPLKAEIVNDTVYIATQGAQTSTGPTIPLTGQIWVFDATNPNNVHLITNLYAGLYHFDLAVDAVQDRLYVASEWYGVLTLDITDLMNEVSLGAVRTGGWCHGSAYYRGYLAEASEGHGIRLFDCSVPSSPQLVAEDTAVGFSRAISFSPDGSYVYAWYLTLDRFRVFDGQTLAPVGNTQVWASTAPEDWAKSESNGQWVAAIGNPIDTNAHDQAIVVVDVSNPAQPSQQAELEWKYATDLDFLWDGKLAVVGDTSLLVLDPANLGVLELAHPTPNTRFRGLTHHRDTLYVVELGTTDRIVRYRYDSLTKTLSLVEATPFNIAQDHRIHLATDGLMLYVASSLDSLKALPMSPPYTQAAIYDHGADYMFDRLWGVTDLYVEDDYLLLNEYMGQTTLLKNAIPLAVAPEVDQVWAAAIPNPCKEALRIVGDEEGVGMLSIWDTQGRKLLWIETYRAGETVSVGHLPTGVFFWQWETKLGLANGKLVHVSE